MGAVVWAREERLDEKVCVRQELVVEEGEQDFRVPRPLMERILREAGYVPEGEGS